MRCAHSFRLVDSVTCIGFIDTDIIAAVQEKIANNGLEVSRWWRELSTGAVPVTVVTQLEWDEAPGATGERACATERSPAVCRELTPPLQSDGSGVKRPAPPTSLRSSPSCLSESPPSS